MSLSKKLTFFWRGQLCRIYMDHRNWSRSLVRGPNSSVAGPGVFNASCFHRFNSSRLMHGTSSGSSFYCGHTITSLHNHIYGLAWMVQAPFTLHDFVSVAWHHLDLGISTQGHWWCIRPTTFWGSGSHSPCRHLDMQLIRCSYSRRHNS